MVLLKILAIIVCAVIAYQDFRERAVLWVLFPVLASCFLGLFSLNMQWELIFVFVAINFLIVSGILLILYLYTKFIMKLKFLNVGLGLGDLFFFYVMAVGFPTISFIILFVGALFFSLAMTIVRRNKSKRYTVPLAGLMGVYLIAILLISFFPLTPSLHTF